VPEDFDINGHLYFLSSVKVVGQLSSHTETFRTAAMITLFMPGSVYDFKGSNPMVYQGSAEFGNWFYGAGAKALGFSKEEALRAAAVVQQYQDYNNNRFDANELLDRTVNAFLTGNGDNPDDPAQIEGGYSYGTKLLNNPGLELGNSCDSIPDFDFSDGAFGYDGLGGSGGGWSSGTFINIGDCWGHCYHGTPKVTIIELPSVRPR
jgi:hypothetical protein